MLVRCKTCEVKFNPIEDTKSNVNEPRCGTCHCGRQAILEQRPRIHRLPTRHRVLVYYGAAEKVQSVYTKINSVRRRVVATKPAVALVGSKPIHYTVIR